MCTCQEVCGVFKFYFIYTLEVRNDAAGINPFLATGFFLYPLKTSENLWFSNFFRGYRKRPERWNWLVHLGPMYPSYRNQFALEINWLVPSRRKHLPQWIKVTRKLFKNKSRRQEMFWTIGLKKFLCFLGR